MRQIERVVVAALAGVVGLSAHAQPGVVSVSASGYIDSDGQLEDLLNNAATPFAPRVDLTGFDGFGTFDQTANEQVALGGVTADISARLQVSATQTAHGAAISYEEMFWGTQSEITNNHGVVGAPNSEVTLTVTTLGTTLVSFSDRYDYLLGVVIYAGDGIIAGGVADGVSADLESLANLDGLGANGILLDAGVHSFTISDQKAFGGDDGFSITHGFDLMFSNVVPGPSALTAVFAIGLTRNRRRRA